MADEKQITVKPIELGPISPEPNKVHALAGRMLAEMAYPQIDKLTNQERYSLALHSLTYNLVPGREIWGIPGKGVMIGKAGWIKGLNEKAEREGFRWWAEYNFAQPRDFQGDLAEDVDRIAMAWVCTIRRSDWIDTYTESIKALSETGMPWEMIDKRMGKMPASIGIGVIWKSELDRLKKGAMTIAERGKKRALAAAARDIIHFSFPNIIEGQRLENGEERVADVSYLNDPNITDGVVTEEPAAPPPSAPEMSKTDDHDTDTGERPWSALELKQATNKVLESKIKKWGEKSANISSEDQAGFAAGVLTKSGLTNKERYTVCSYLFGRKIESCKELTGPEASVIIDYGLDGDLKNRVAELKAAVRQDAIDKGQLEFDIPEPEQSELDKHFGAKNGEEIEIIWNKEEINTFEKLVTSARLGKVNPFITKHAKMSPAEFYDQYTPGEAKKFLNKVQKTKK